MLLNQGLELLVYGMGTVVVFLSLLVIAMGVMSRLVLRYFPEPEMPAGADRRPPAASQDPEPPVLAAIAAALHQHRRRRR